MLKLDSKASWAALLLVYSVACNLSGSKSSKINGEKSRIFFEKQNLYTSGEGGYFCYRIPALVTTTKGTVLAFCEARKNDCKDWDDIDIVMRRSFDHGKTWEQMRVIAQDGAQSVNQPCPVVDSHTGTIWLPFCKNNQQVFVTKSTDDGVTWSSPVEITKDVKDSAWSYVGSGPGHGLQLQSGRLLIPSWADSTPGPVTWAPSPNWGKVQFSYAFYSDDHGLTWKRGQTLEKDMSDECEVVEPTDGRVYMNMRSRNNQKRRAYAWSQDGGETWSKVQFDERLPEPSCQGSLIRFTDETRFAEGSVLLAHPASPNERAQLTVRLSSDGCQTWPVAKVLNQGSSGYSDLAVASNQTILCLYEADQNFKGSNPFQGGTAEDLRKLEASPHYFDNISRHSKLVLARFNIQWLTDGADS
jgi:sialidase-1